MKKNFMKVLTMGMSVVLLLAGCSSDTTKTSSGEKMYKIGVTQIADHPSLDNCRNGFIEGLKQEGFEEGKNIQIDFQSAQNDTNVQNQISQNFASDSKDLVCGIATPSAQSLYNACYEKGIPVVFNAVSDPIEAKIANSDGTSKEGITGVSDALPVDAQLKLIRAMLPDAKKIGILYTTSEANSVSTLKTYKELAGNYDFEIVDKGVGTAAEVPQATDILLSEVDAISNMTDNNVVATLSVVLEKANAAGKPVFGSEEEQVANGCVASAGLDYFELGIQAGKIGARILKGEKPADIKYETMKESKITINQAVADSLAISVPSDIKANADIK